MVMVGYMKKEKCMACGGDVKEGRSVQSHDCWGKIDHDYIPARCEHCGADQELLKRKLARVIMEKIVNCNSCANFSITDKLVFCDAGCLCNMVNELNTNNYFHMGRCQHYEN